jgi:outer membrane protein assembly factor BamB
MLLATLLAALHVTSGTSDDAWPGWRGNGSGIASGSPPIEWAEDHNVRWKTALPGKGLSSPIVWKERVYVTASVGTGKKAEVAPEEARPEGDGPPRREGEGGGERGRGEGRGGPGGRGRAAPLEEQDFVVLALDRATGAIAWQQKLATAMPHQGTHRDGSYASPTPVTDGERLYVSFGSYGVFALDLTGKVVWQVDLGDMQINNGFGEGSSPVLVAGNVVIAWDHEGDSFLVALDAATGEERWRTARAKGTSWTTPILVKSGGKEELVVGGARITAYDPATGAELWHHGEAGRGGAIASPVALDELVVFALGGRGAGEARAVVVQPAGAEAADPLLWSAKVDAPHVPSPLAYDGKVYLLKQDSGMLSVLDPTSGKLEYGPERLEGVADVYASLVATEGRLYVAGRDGTVEVLSAWPEIGTIGVNHLEDGFDASPAIAGDELFLRGLANLYCIAEN